MFYVGVLRESLFDSITFKIPRRGHHGDPNQTKGLKKQTRITYAKITYLTLEIAPKTQMHQKEP